MPEITNEKLTIGLRSWAKKNDIGIKDFHQKTGYTYTYAWDLLRGKAEFTTEGYGRFCIAFGLAAGQELMELAGE
jgi:hypothetical protein